MSEIATPPPAKAPPLFTVDLKENGGLFAPTGLNEVSSWIQHEVNFWSWLNASRAGGNHDQGIKQAVNQLNQAQNTVNQGPQYKDSNPQRYQNQLECIRSQLEEAFLRQRLPHSPTPLAKRIEDYRKEAGDHTASFFASVFVPPQQGHHFQPQELVGWRGLVEGLIERYGLASAPATGRKQAADQSFEQLRVKAEALLGDKTTAYDALHRGLQRTGRGHQDRSGPTEDRLRRCPDAARRRLREAGGGPQAADGVPASDLRGGHCAASTRFLLGGQAAGSHHPSQGGPAESPSHPSPAQP